MPLSTRNVLGMLCNIPLRYVKTCHCDWFSKMLGRILVAERMLGKRRVGEARQTQNEPDTQNGIKVKASW